MCFFFQAEDGIRDRLVTGVQTCALPILIRADLEVPEERRDIRLADRSRQVITTCGVGNLAAMGAKLLKEMGFTNVLCMAGGMQGWKDAGLPTG